MNRRNCTRRARKKEGGGRGGGGASEEKRFEAGLNGKGKRLKRKRRNSTEVTPFYFGWHCSVHKGTLYSPK